MLLGEEPEFKLDDQSHAAHGGCEEYEVTVESEGELWCVHPEHLVENNESYPPLAVTSSAHVHPGSTTLAHAKATATSGPAQTAEAKSVDATVKLL